MMKKNLILILLACVAFAACKKSEKLTYDSPENIYLNYSGGSADTITYSFAYVQGVDRDTIWVPVIISGNRVNRDRSFILQVVDTATSAVKDLHYEPLKETYTMPANSGRVNVPVIIKNTDKELENKSVTLTVRVSGGQDFGTNLPDTIRKKTIMFSNRLERPQWWNFWEGELKTYSRTKHQLFLITSGTRDLIDLSTPDYYLYIPRSLYYIENTRTFLKYPFDWIRQHPDSGYVLTKRTDNSGDYDFYSVNAPDKKFLLKYFSSVDQYRFIDENNKEINM
ncbi:DUF4843 domain-containing protein [Mucilaginibacter roseus]|uniref:DUF4843 domain-containing protein n=1 Tax=Mucilaginibacter roseus TaxID=1528868 RepID=A0ABS8U7K2_9SPHI|nr:DUF4843 domain-containing protein [Mucilaginibacter roseus]MCD8742125.1 DUF4843 domain-containing protein [Mucilaginibacter roseus]